MKCWGVEFVIFFGLIQYGSAIVCYECNSAINPLCSEAFLYDDRLKRNCSDHDRGVTHTLCRIRKKHMHKPPPQYTSTIYVHYHKLNNRFAPQPKHHPEVLVTWSPGVLDECNPACIRKIIQYVDHDINGHIPVGRVIRSCGWDETKYMNACYHRSGYGGRQEVCSCSTDLCNGSEKLGATYFIVGAALLNILQMHLNHNYD